MTAYAQLFALARWRAMVVAFSRQSCFLWSQASGEAGFRQQIITDEKLSLEQRLPVCVTKLQRIREKWKFMCHGLQPGYRPLQGWKSPRLNCCLRERPHMLARQIWRHTCHGSFLAGRIQCGAAAAGAPPSNSFGHEKRCERTPAFLSIKIPRQWGDKIRKF